MSHTSETRKTVDRINKLTKTQLNKFDKLDKGFKSYLNKEGKDNSHPERIKDHARKVMFISEASAVLYDAMHDHREYTEAEKVLTEWVNSIEIVESTEEEERGLYRSSDNQMSIEFREVVLEALSSRDSMRDYYWNLVDSLTQLRKQK